MKISLKNDNNQLFVGMLIGSVIGVAFGAVITNFFSKLAGKAWVRVTQRQESREVDPRWLLQ